MTTVDANSATTAEYTCFGPGRMKDRSIQRGGMDIVTTLSYDNGPRITGISHTGLENPGSSSTFSPHSMTPILGRREFLPRASRLADDPLPSHHPEGPALAGSTLGPTWLSRRPGQA